MAVKESRPTVNLEASLKSLEAIVHQMESENLPLEEALKCFEEGVKLSATCQTLLKEAEQKIEMVQNSLENLKKGEDKR